VAKAAAAQQQQQLSVPATSTLDKKNNEQGCMQHGMDMDMDGFPFRCPPSFSLSPHIPFCSGLSIEQRHSLPLSLPFSFAFPSFACASAATLLQRCLLLLLIHTFLIELSRSR